MIEVFIINEEFTPIHDNSTRLTMAQMDKEINTIPIFDFAFLPNNPANALIRLNKTILRVIRLIDGKEMFEGVVFDYAGEIDTDGRPSKEYLAEDALGFLRHSQQPKFTYKGTPGGLIEIFLTNHNEQVEDWKQFTLGVCEVDTFDYYPDTSGENPEEPEINVTLEVGDPATIKPGTQYIYNGDGTRLNINTAVNGVTHTVEAIGVGVNEGRYLLRHPSWGPIGYIAPEDIVETRIVDTDMQTFSLMSTTATTSSDPNQTMKVTIKQSATTYYVDSYVTNGVPIPSFIKESTSLYIYPNNDNLKNNGRYALYRDGVHIAWISESDLNMGTPSIDPVVPDRPGSVQQKRIIEVEVDRGNTWENIIEHIIDNVGGEIERLVVEGVYQLNIRNRIGYESETVFETQLNIQQISEQIDASEIITKVRPIGKKPLEEGA